MVAIDTTRALSPRIAHTVIAFVLDTLDAIRAYREIRVTERTLHALSDHELNDIGLTRGDIYTIARNPAR